MVREKNAAAMPPEERVSGLEITPELIEAYLAALSERGRTAETVQTYRHNLQALYTWLPEDKRVLRGTLAQWREEMRAEEYAVRTINSRIAAANGLVEFRGLREYQVERPLKPPEAVQPELTRTEYLRLLSTARALGQERTYLLVKVFGTLGLSLQELPKLTVEAAEAGRLAKAPRQTVRLPECLREELLGYAERAHITGGPIFASREGKPLHRSLVTYSIRALCREARVAEEKGNPRCLRKLYQTTQAGIRANLTLLVEQAHDRILETEQLSIGWREVSCS